MIDKNLFFLIDKAALKHALSRKEASLIQEYTNTGYIVKIIEPYKAHIHHRISSVKHVIIL